MDNQGNYVNPYVRQLPRKQSPLSRDFVASGYYYDKRTGLVQKLTTTP